MVIRILVSQTKIFIVIIASLLLCLPISIFAQVEFTSSNIPIVIIETNGQEILDDPRIIADMGIIDNGESTRNFITDSYNGYNGKISIEIRGSTSQLFAKKQYAFETQNEDSSNNNVSLLGLPSENDWILYAPYSDKSLIRNILAYKLSEMLGHYAPRTKLCELVLNGEYMGVYVLIEKIKRDENRVDITKLEEGDIVGDDLTGGYIIKLDKITGNYCYGFNTNIVNTFVQYEYPDCDKIVYAQKMYIINYLNSFEEALFSDTFADTVIGYRRYLDLNSAIDYFIVNEISKNIDAYLLSTFIYKDRDSKGGKLKYGPVWDFNLAFGNANYSNGYKTNGLIAPTRHLWWNRLFEDTTFNCTLKERWIEVRKNQISDSQIIHIIDSLTQYIDESQKRNFVRWDILDSHIWPNYYVGYTYENEIVYLKGWIINRLGWLDNEVYEYCEQTYPIVNSKVNIYPNPFDYFITYVFSLKEDGIVTLHLYDDNGRFIANIIDNTYYKEGEYQIIWNSYIGDNIIPNGFYVLVLKNNGNIISRELIIKK